MPRPPRPSAATAWYYISATEKQVAFFTPTVLKRSILAVYFDKDGKVTAVRHYGLQDGHVIAFETRETPARGRELTFLQQLLNATPGTSATQMQETNPGNGGGVLNRVAIRAFADSRPALRCARGLLASFLPARYRARGSCAAYEQRKSAGVATALFHF